MSTIGIDIRIGNADTGAKVEPGQFSAFHVFHMQNPDVAENRISIEEFLKSLRSFRLKPSPIALDLLVIACAAYAADTSINRHKNSEDGWTRQFHLFVPVSELGAWNAQQRLIEEILNFLTGDLWRISFRQSTQPITVAKRQQKPTSYVTDTVCLFSGGMDSFIGAMKMLNEGKRPLLVGHAKSSDVSHFRNEAGNALRQRFAALEPRIVQAFVRCEKPRVDGVAIRGENTERGRSFLFLAIGAVCASALPVDGKKKKLYIPENGFIALNLPLTPLRMGAYSTRTAHPYYLKLMRQLFDGLEMDLDLENPFEDKTKGEMLLDSGDPGFVANAATMSCSRPSTRNAKVEGAGMRHCGRCVPCIIRRAALRKAKILDDNAQLPEERQYRTDIFSEPLQASNVRGENVMAFRYMIERIKLDSNFLKSAIHLTGPLDAPEKSLVLYQRGLDEVAAILQHVNVVD
mgnify:CR=1 FL=1